MLPDGCIGVSTEECVWEYAQSLRVQAVLYLHCGWMKRQWSPNLHAGNILKKYKLIRNLQI